jgi:hypothetical protein
MALKKQAYRADHSQVCTAQLGPDYKSQMLDTNGLGCPRGGGCGGGGRTRFLRRHQVICLPVNTNAAYQFQLQPWLEKERVLRVEGCGGC